MYNIWPKGQNAREVQWTVVLLYLEEKIVSDQTCLRSGKSGYPAKIHPVDFEKDDDSNFHMDFIVACSNLRLGFQQPFIQQLTQVNLLIELIMILMVL